MRRRSARDHQRVEADVHVGRTRARDRQGCARRPRNRRRRRRWRIRGGVLRHFRAQLLRQLFLLARRGLFLFHFVHPLVQRVNFLALFADNFSKLSVASCICFFKASRSFVCECIRFALRQWFAKLQINF